MTVLASYAVFIDLVRTGLLYLGALVAVVCAFDWAVRTRRINPFSRSARFFRGRIEPLMTSVERMIVRSGGSPATAPWWVLAGFAIAGIVLISLLQFAGTILGQVMFVAASDDWHDFAMLLASWTFAVLRLALLVRVLSSWFPISPHSKWIRWSFGLTDWIITPLRRVVPRVGMFDITPIVAWILLLLAQSALRIP